MTGRTRTAVDRTILGLGGLVLARAGSWLAAMGRTVTDRLPSWWPTASAGSVLLDRGRLAHLRGEGWWTPTATATAIALSVLCAYGTLARLRPGRVLPRPGRRREIGLRVWLEPSAAPETVLPALCTVAAEAERAAAPYTAHTRVRLSAAAPHRSAHVR